MAPAQIFCSPFLTAMEDEFEDSDGDVDYSAGNEFQETETEYAVISIHIYF